MTQQLAFVHDGASEAVDGIGAMLVLIDRGRHLTLLGRGRRRWNDLFDRRRRLRAPWPFEHVVHHNPDESQHGTDESDGLKPVLPYCEGKRNTRMRRKVSVLLRLVDVVQNVDDV